MATDPPGRSSGRPRPWLVVLLILVAGAYLLTRMFSVGSATPSVSRTGAPRAGAAAKNTSPDPSELDVRIEALAQAAPSAGAGNRNPFRFQPRPEPSMPSGPPQSFEPAPVDPGPTEPSGAPPIGNTIKFIGIVETGKVRIGAFSYFDEASRQCTATFPGREGEILEGRYRIVRIGVESAVLEYADGTGRTTIPLNGQACVVR